MNITRLNFAESLPFIRSTLQSAHYLSFDLQMSGIMTEELTTPSIIDSMQIRYEKQRQSVSKFIPLQFGLSAFRVLPNQKRIIVQPFNFYIFPLTQEQELMKFSFHAGTMNFLTKNKFDFNRLFYEGVPYCSRQRMRNMVREKKLNEMKQELKRMKQIESPTTLAFLKVHLPTADDWIRSDRATLQIPIEFMKVQSYLAFKDKVEELYPNQPFLFSFDSEDVIRRTKLILQKCTIQEKQKSTPGLDCSPPVDKMFNEVVEEMVALRKPIIVHNGYLDLMHVYYRFFESLPPHWNTYRKEINNLFPHIYDNKYLFNSSPTLLHSTPNRMTGLQNCFTGMREIQKKEAELSNRKDQVGGVRFELGEEFKQYKMDSLACHQAGFDALMTGYSFLKGITHLKNDLQLLADTQAFAFEQQLIRNRTPQGSIKVPFNFEEGGVDIYSQDTNSPLFFRSVLNTPISEQTLIDYFTGRFGSVNFYWTTRDQTQFCIIFVSETDQSKYIQHLETRKLGAFSIDEIEGVQLLILSKEQHEESMKNFIKGELAGVEQASK